MSEGKKLMTLQNNTNFHNVKQLNDIKAIDFQYIYCPRMFYHIRRINSIWLVVLCDDDNNKKQQNQLNQQKNVYQNKGKTTA